MPAQYCSIRQVDGKQEVRKSCHGRPANAGIGVGGPPTSDLFQVPHLWLASRDRSKFASGHVIAGTSLASGSRDVNAVLGGGLKLSTGTTFWSPGTHVVPMRTPREPQSFWQRISPPQMQSEGGGRASSIGPAGARFGVASNVVGQVHQHSSTAGAFSGWTSAKPTKIRGHGFVVQELPLPITSHRSGATWLRVKLETPSQSYFLNSDGSRRSGPLDHGRLTASVQTDMLVGCDYSKMTFGVRSRYRTARGSQGITCNEPVEMYAKFRHNKQVLRAAWLPDKGVRIEFSRLF